MYNLIVLNICENGLTTFMKLTYVKYKNERTIVSLNFEISLYVGFLKNIILRISYDFGYLLKRFESITKHLLYHHLEQFWKT